MPLFGTFSSRRRGGIRDSGLIIELQKILLVSCQDIITLDAVLIGTPNGPQTYLWTQQSGSPVTWLEDQDQTMVTFQQPVTRDDKVFRFWLNKGTSYQQYADILVTLINLDSFNKPTHGPLMYRRGTDAQTVQGPFGGRPASNSNQPGVVVLNNASRMIQFNSPTNAQYLFSVIASAIIDGVKTEIAEIPITVNYLDNLDGDIAYQLDSVFDISGYSTAISGPVYMPRPSVGQELAFIEPVNVGIGRTRGITGTTSTITRTLDSFETDLDTMTGQISNRGLTATTNTVTRSLETFSTDEDTFPGGYNNIARGLTFTKTVTNASYSSIG
jgi:hypothetical protein